jgi:hypothetical protein
MKMDNLKKIRRLFCIIVPFVLVLSLLLIGFQSILVIQGSTALAIDNAGLQRSRSTAIAKNALILAYRTDIKERVQAISDLQVIVPLFEQEQGVLNSYRPTDIQLLMSSSRSDYLALDAALKSIILHQDRPIDQIQVDIILAHTTSYNVAINQVVIAIQNHVDDEVRMLFLIEVVIDALLIILAIVLFVSVLRMTKEKKI